MKKFVAFFGMFLAFGVWHKGVAQFNVTLNVDPNPTPKILEWALNPQTVNLTVTNLTSNTEKYKIKAQLYKDNELVGETRPEVSPLRIIDANSVEVYFAEDVVPEGATKLYGNIDKIVIKTGKIPAGTYRLCTKLVDESGQINLTTDYCQTFFVSSYQQPRLILPLDGSSVPYTGATSSLNFQWSPVLPQPRFPVYYQVRVVPKMVGQTALYAFRYNTPVINEKVAGSTNFIWSVNSLEIEPERDYVWGVIAMDDDEKAIGENEGLSEIWEFRFVEPSTTTVKIINNLQAPKLIYPSDKKILNKNINQINFTWTGLKPIQNSGVNYEFRLVEKPDNNTALHWFNYGTPLISQVILNDTFLSVNILNNNIDKDKEYVWGVIPKDPHNGNDFIQNAGYLDKFVFSFGTENLPQLTKFDFKQSFPRLSSDKSHALITIDIADDALSFNDNYLIKPYKYEILPMANEPLLELYDVDTSHFHPDYHAFKLKKISAAPNSPLNLMEDLSGTYNIKYQYHVLKRESFRLDTIALRDTTLTLTFPIDERFPQLTKFDFKQSFPRLSPDKSHTLVTIDVADDALSFTDSYILKPFKYEILPMANEPPLELYTVDTSHFHSDYHVFKIKKISAAPNSPLNLMEDLSGTYNIKYQYHILKREPFRLDTIALRDTTLTLTFPIDERFPQLTQFDFKQSYPRLSPDKSHTLVTIDVADDALSFTDNYLLKPFKYEILPLANEPSLELYDVDTSQFHPDYHVFKIKKISAAPNSPLNLMEDLSGTYNIKYQYHILKREPFRLDTIALRDTTLTLSFPIDERFPQLTKFDFKQSFPRLSPDKSHTLVTIDVADDALSFTDSYILKPFKYEILPMANEPPLEIYDVDTSRFHPDYHFFKLKKLNAAPNSPLALMEDLSGTYTIKYQYHILKREPFRLDTIALRDTTLTLSFPIDERFPQLTKFDFKQSFPRLSPDKKHTLVEIELDDDLASYSPQYEIKPFSYQVLPKAQASPLQLLVLDTSDYDLHTFNLSINGTTPMDGLSGTYEILYKYHVLKREPFKLDTIALIDTSLTITFPLNTFNPGCDPVPCTPNTANLISSLPIDSIVKLCGGLTMKVLSVSASNNSQFTGTGEVYIPWLASKFNTTFTNIKVNASNELAVGDITVVRASGAPTYNSFASNVGISAIKKIAKWASTNSPIDIPSGAINAANNLQTSALKVPLGITKAAGNGKTGMTIAISDIKFSPSQNLLQAYAAISFGGGPNDTISFQSENFYFTSAGPIKNIGNANELKFPLFSDITVPYGSTNNNPLQLKFKKSGTFLNLTSACNEGLNWCMNVDMDIEMPRAWLLPKDDDGTGNMKAKASLKTDICDLNDILVAINLDTTIIAGTNGIKLSVNSLVWDNSTKKNTSNFTFPSTVNVDWKGFTLANANLTLPRDFIQNATNVSINLNNWVIDYKKGITGEVTKSNLITFPNLSLVDISGSIDSFKLIIKDNSITYGKIKGQLLLPLCNATSSNPTVGNLNYAATINSNGLNFSLTPNGGAMMDCPFFANGNLSILNTSSLRLILNKNKSEFNFTLNGKLDFPDKSIGPIKLSLDADFENIKFDYVKDKVNSNNNTVTFDEGDWNFASPQKLLNYFPFTIDEVRKEIRTNLSTGELYVGGVGFDLVANLNDNIGGEAGLAILGSINYSNGKLTAGFKGVEVDTVVVYANTNSVKLDGELIFQDTIINGDSIKAVKGSLAADFKCLNVGVSAGAIFGKVIENNNPDDTSSYRFFMVQAKALFTPGVPLFAGIALVGGGFGFYKNMEMVVNDSILGLNGQAASSQVFAGASFTPSKGPWGIKIQADIATTPSDEAFNGNIAFHGEFDANTGGLTHLGVIGNGYSGAGVLERDQAFLNANLTASYDFTTRIFDLSIIANINKAPVLYANNVSAKLKVDGMRNKYFFHFGTPEKPNDVIVLSTFNSSMYLMFGNDSIYAPTNYFMPETRAGLEAVGAGNTYKVPGFSAAATGAGFAVGVGISATGSGKACFGAFEYTCKAGAEFNLSMLKYFQALCYDKDDNPYLTNIGYKNYYLTTKLAFYAGASGFWLGVKIVDFNAYAELDAGFPNPEYFYGDIGGSIKVGQIEMANSFHFKFGNNCDPPTSLPTTSQSFTQEDATTKIGDIFTDIYIDNNDNNYNPEKALQWKANFGYDESFTIPEQQSDGTVKTRKFDVKWDYKLSQKVVKKINGVNTAVYEQINRHFLGFGKDPNGRWCLSKTFDKFGTSWRVSESDGFSFSPYKIKRRQNFIAGRVWSGDFDGNGFDDIMFVDDDNYTKIIFNDGATFYSPQPTNISATYEMEIADFDGDGSSDILFYDGNINIYKKGEFQGIQYNFTVSSGWKPQNWPLNHSFFIVTDYDSDGKSDIATFEKALRDSSTVSYNHQARVYNPLFQGGGDPIDQAVGDGAVFKVTVFLSNGGAFQQGQIWQRNAPYKLGMLGERMTYKNRSNTTSICWKIIHPPSSSIYHLHVINAPDVQSNKLAGDTDLSAPFDFSSMTNILIGNFYDSTVGDEQLSANNRTIVGNYSDSQNDNIIRKDLLYFNITESYNKNDPYYRNYLTPNRHYKLELNGEITEGGNSIKSENIFREFQTGSSDTISQLIYENAERLEYFPPSMNSGSNVNPPPPPVKPKGKGKNAEVIINTNGPKNKNI